VPVDYGQEDVAGGDHSGVGGDDRVDEAVHTTATAENVAQDGPPRCECGVFRVVLL
jgi:hypothetical protein